MCLELTYANSPADGLVEFAYLAVGDKIIINKSQIETDDDGERYVETHGGQYESHLWMQWNDNDGNIILTALLNYHDSDEYEGSLNESLVYLDNHGLGDELMSNITDMYIDAFHNAGFCGTYVGELLQDANQKTNMIYWRTVDFQMHEPSKENIHPSYDT